MLIAKGLGFIFELGFNVGILTGIEQKKITHSYGNYYRQELQKVQFPKMVKRLKSERVSTEDQEVVERWCQFFLLRGFLAGVNFLQEYLDATGWRKENKIEVVYLQCCFSGENSLSTNDNDFWKEEVLGQWGDAISSRNKVMEKYQKQGDFLNADLLILFRYNRRKKERSQYRVLCVDLSAFSPRSDQEVKNVGFVEMIKQLLRQETRYLRTKSVFSQLRVDTSCLDVELSENLRTYFSAFRYGDKESAKLIQAGGYLYSFYQFLLEEARVLPECPMVLTGVGYSNRGFSSICVKSQQVEFLKTCYEIYSQFPKSEEILEGRRRVLGKIKQSAKHSFEEGKEFINDLLSVSPNEVRLVTHQERLTGFVNGVSPVSEEVTEEFGLSEGLTLQNAHSQLIQRELVGEGVYLFLTGNPGIGKTTAIANFLKSHRDEGFLFIYASPRKQVNLDILEKFKDESGQFCDDRIFAINSHGKLIADQGGRQTVEYLSNTHQEDFVKGGTLFCDRRICDRTPQHQPQLDRKNANTIQEKENRHAGVLKSVCHGIHTAIDHPELSCNQIIATVTIQSLKKTPDGKDTLQHLETIFKSVYSKKHGMIIPDAMEKLSHRIKHLIIMIDEITGDDSGVEFLQGLDKLVKKYKLTQHGFNTKIIVADASIVDPAVIQKHLSNSSPEPDKIYFRHTKTDPKPLSLQPFQFKEQPAIVINTNSYPAKSLTIDYKIFIESVAFQENYLPKQLESFKTQADKQEFVQLLQDIVTTLNNSKTQQIIVYIQNKPKLEKLIANLQKQLESFEKYQDYLEIHADIPETEKQQVEQHKNNVRVIFMTASGSRGLSFPKTTEIFVEIPRFEIEKNLMEVIQVIYRGRGNPKIDQQEKALHFYIIERSIYSQDNAEISLKESILNVLNLLILLKVSIMTRIQGYGMLGRNQQFMIIPIGGKAVSTVGGNFTEKLANLIYNLNKQAKLHPNYTHLQDIAESLQNLLSQADFVIQDFIQKNEELSYLTLREKFNTHFINIVNRGLENLINFPSLELGYLSGSLLIVPIKNKILESSYLLTIQEIEKSQDGQLLKQMQAMSKDPQYPENLQYLLRNGIELLNNLQVERSQILAQTHSHSLQDTSDQYYTFPAIAFITHDTLSKYFTSSNPEAGDNNFRDILYQYLRSLYSCQGTVFPIGHHYQTFPFLLFRNYNLKDIRRKQFSEQYLLNSPTLNVLNLILTH